MEDVKFFLMASLMLLLPELLWADIYKYKDEKGRWQYTDKEPLTKKNVIVEKVSAEPSSEVVDVDRSAWENIEEKLYKKYMPQSEIEKATLAVVKIKTILGVGSGFFVSNSGHIVTNRHVIRPQTSTSWKKTAKKLESESVKFKTRFKFLKDEKNRISLMEEDLEIYRDQLSNPRRYSNPISKKRYEYYEGRYNNSKKKYKKQRKSINYSYSDFKKRKTSLTRRLSNAAVARSFKVIFKDNSTASAQLVKISSKQDIAILKLTNHITPYLKRSFLDKLPQAMPVYVIGSPLGQSDSVTSGIVTRVNESEIITDATILPGNSGGPLVDKAGDVLGVNTLKLMAGKTDGAEGFGVAIPIQGVFKEFGDIIPVAAEN